MVRNASLGALVFGVLGAAAGYIWTAFEFPFAIILPAFAGWYAVVRPDFGNRKALYSALVGGVAFTGVLLVGMFLAITDGSPVPITGSLAAILAAVVAGALTGMVFGGTRAALPIAAFSAVGMSIAVLAAGILRGLTPEAANVPGFTQYAYFALAMGVIGGFVGAAVGAGVSWVRRQGFVSHDEEARVTTGRPHPV